MEDIAIPHYAVRGGQFCGDGVFHAPTGTKFYRRPEHLDAPLAIVLHYTACHASERSLVSAKRLIDRASDRLDNEDGAIDALYVDLLRLGYCPDAVSLTLQNATRERMASWCLLVGSIPMHDGTIPVCQYSPNMTDCGTMHAGSPPTWRARKKYGKKKHLTSRGELRWDGRDYRWPEHDGHPVVNVNPYTIGIEVMLYGPMGKAKRIAHPSVPVVEVDGRHYELPSDEQVAALTGVVRALRRAYGDIPVWGHSDVTPTKVDPWPPLPRFDALDDLPTYGVIDLPDVIVGRP